MKCMNFVPAVESLLRHSKGRRRRIKIHRPIFSAERTRHRDLMFEKSSGFQREIYHIGLDLSALEQEGYYF
jgi:hypothetical protein